MIISARIAKPILNIFPFNFITIRILLFLIPKTPKLNKYRNVLLAQYEIKRRATFVRNYPITIGLALVNICNYLCQFCEIHKDNMLFPKRIKNILGPKEILFLDSLFKHASYVGFRGGSAEPLLAKDFSQTLKYLKTSYGISLYVNTNASTLNKPLADQMIKYGFDHVFVSYHAGTPEGYKTLMTGNIERVHSNLTYLSTQKRKLNKKLPMVEFNFALHKKNASEYSAVIDNAKTLGADSIMVSKYYGGSNAFDKDKPAFDYDPEKGNQVLDELYEYARQASIPLNPPAVDHWDIDSSSVAWNPENYDKQKHCTLPWTSMQFNPVLNEPTSLFAGVCNRISLFKINHKVLSDDKTNRVDALWNHEIIQYLRSTVNEKDINPICKFCKNRNFHKNRNTNNEIYASVRDQSVRAFFENFRKSQTFIDMPGIEVLSHNPFEMP
jgi:uncharacterized Fe-S cluster-containing radical SAM superfamily protein